MSKKEVALNISAAVAAVAEAMDTGNLTLDQILSKAPEVALTVRVPAVYALLVETYATQNGLPRLASKVSETIEVARSEIDAAGGGPDEPPKSPPKPRRMH